MPPDASDFPGGIPALLNKQWKDINVSQVLIVIYNRQANQWFTI